MPRGLTRTSINPRPRGLLHENRATLLQGKYRESKPNMTCLEAFKS